MNAIAKQVYIKNAFGGVAITASEHESTAIISSLLNILTQKQVPFSIQKRRPTSETTVKIAHNNLRKLAFLSAYLQRIDIIENSFAEIDSEIAFGKSTIYETLHNLYRQVLDDLEISYFFTEPDIESIREKSDFIVCALIEKTKAIVMESKNSPDNIEIINNGILSIIAHAFIECIILENPEK